MTTAETATPALEVSAEETGSTSQRADDSDLWDVVLAHEHLIDRAIALWRYRPRSASADLADMRQEAWFGLLNAAKTFDPQRGARFETWALWCIRNGLRSAAGFTAAPAAPAAAATSDSLAAAQVEMGPDEVAISNMQWAQIVAAGSNVCEDSLDWAVFLALTSNVARHLSLRQVHAAVAEEHNVSLETVRLRSVRLRRQLAGFI